MVEKKAEADEWVIDFKGWKQKEKTAFTRAMAESNTKGDESDVYPHLARLVKKWPYSWDPTNVESYGELDVLEYDEVLLQVTERFQEYRKASR